MRFEWSMPAFVAGLLLGAALLALAYPVLRRRRPARRTQRDGVRAEPAEPALERSEDGMAELRGRLEALANALPEGLLYVDARLVCRGHNEAAERMLELAPGQIDDVALREVLGEASFRRVEEQLARVLQGEQVQLRQVRRNAEDRASVFDVRYVPHCDRTGHVLGFHALLTPASDEPVVEVPEQTPDQATVEQTPDHATVERTPDHAPPEQTPDHATVEQIPGHAAVEQSLDHATVQQIPDHAAVEEVPDRAVVEQAQEEAAAPGAVAAPDEPAPSEHFAQSEARRALFLEALHSGQFRLFEQAIVPVDRAPAERTQHEILLRLRSEKSHLLHPAAFLDVGSDGGFLRDLDRWVVTRLLRWYAKHRDSLDPAARTGFHVNLSAETIRDESFPTFLDAVLRSRAVAPEALCFEIAEADVTAHRQEAIACAYALRMLGCRVAVDHFGGASQSFSALVGMPADFVKIDGGIIGHILDDPRSRTKARAIVKVAQSMGARTIAERVEDADTLAALRTLGIDYAQGFGIAMPEPIERLTGRSERKLRAGASA